MDQVNSLAELRPGDIGFGPIHGGAGLLVSAGQLLLGEGFRVGRLDVRHVFVVVSNDNGAQPDVYAVEAEPGGAQQVLISNEHARWTEDYAYVRLSEDYPGQAGDAAAIARAMIGTPYSFGSYAALAAWRLGWKTPRLERWIGRRHAPGLHYPVDLPGWNKPGVGTINLPCEAICSVLADQAWSLTGKKIMEGVAHQCVTPGALARRLLEMDGARWIWPGKVMAS